MTPTTTYVGGEHQVTGSCHLLRANGLNIMVDGLFFSRNAGIGQKGRLWMDTN